MEGAEAVGDGVLLGRGEFGKGALVAGKGHETTQVFATHTEPFDDRAELLGI